MYHNTMEPVWQERIQQIEPAFENVAFPAAADPMSQDKEWCEVVCNGRRRRIRFHDYHEIFSIPGLYEAVFYERLACNSPTRVAALLADLMEDGDESPEDLRVFDVGAGNGMVGDELAAIGVRHLVGVDIIPEAEEATHRDRPGLYADYAVADLTDMDEPTEERMRKHNLNCLTCVAALGFGDIPPKAFTKALDLLETPAWLAFNIKEDFLHECDNTGFCRLIRKLSRERIIQIQSYRRYQHRLNVHGEPLHYVAMVARKLRDVPASILDDPEVGCTCRGNDNGGRYVSH